MKQFGPSEVAAMLPGLSGAECATVYGLLGGMPLYLDWWDQEADLLDDLVELASRPGDRLQLEAEPVLATEAGSEGLPGAVLRAIAKGATRFNEIQSAVSANPTRTLTNLARLQLIEPVIPAGQDERSKQKYYRWQVASAIGSPPSGLGGRGPGRTRSMRWSLRPRIARRSR